MYRTLELPSHSNFRAFPSPQKDPLCLLWSLYSHGQPQATSADLSVSFSFLTVSIDLPFRISLDISFGILIFTRKNVVCWLLFEGYHVYIFLITVATPCYSAGLSILCYQNSQINQVRNVAKEKISTYVKCSVCATSKSPGYACFSALPSFVPCDSVY